MLNTTTIVGAGPAGLTTAKRIAERGYAAIVLEEHPQIGIPTNCTGLISKTGTAMTNLPYQDVLVNEIRGAKIFAPNGNSFSIDKYETVAYVVDRGKLDQALAKEAQKAGVEIRTNCRMMDVRNHLVFTQQDDHGETLKSQIVVGADGVNSKTRTQLMKVMVGKEKFVNSYQALCKGEFQKEFVELHFGSSFAPHFFAWVVPENKHYARIGTAAPLGINVKQCFDQFLTQKQLNVEVKDGCAFLIPVGEPLPSVTSGNLALVGDAGFQTKATTGGGIITGCMAGKLLGDAIADHYAKNKPLKEYDKSLSALNRELMMHYKIRKYLNTLPDAQMNKMFEKAKNAGIDRFLEKYGNMDLPSLFMGKVFTNPRMWSFAPEALKFLMT